VTAIEATPCVQPREQEPTSLQQPGEPAAALRLIPGRLEKLQRIAPDWNGPSQASSAYDSYFAQQQPQQGGTDADEEPGLIIMRHGQSDHNIANSWNSSPDNEGYVESNLTEKGIEQVLATAALLANRGLSNANVGAIYVSTLPRAQQTADVLAQRLQIAPEKVLLNSSIVETNRGKYEGKAEQGLTDKLFGKHDFSEAHSYGGETTEDVAKRTTQFIDQLLSQCDKKSNIVVVSHGTPTQLMLEHLLGPQKEGLKTAGFIKISWKDLQKRRNASNSE